MRHSTLLGCVPLVWLALLCTLPVSPACDAQAAQDSRPNVLFMISDDQTFDTFSAAGHPLLETPHIDSIAAAGVRFTNAFVTTSVCSPARASFLTGRYARNHGVLNNSKPLPADLPTFASVLRAGGYDTGYFGKWHMGTQGPRPGFGTSFSYIGQGLYHDCAFYVDGTFEKVRVPGFVDNAATDHAIEWMTGERDGPFLACVGFKATHGPREPQPIYDELFADADLATPASLGTPPPYPRPGELKRLAEAAGTEPRQYDAPADWAVAEQRKTPSAGNAFAGEGMREYLRLIVGLDQNVGRLLQALEDHGLAENTIVVFVSDNGYMHGHHGTIGKRAAYEESMRVITLVHDPRPELPAGPRDELVLNIDLAPTLIDLAGLEIPTSMDGRSLRPLLEGQALDGPGNAWRRDFLYEYYRNKRYPVPTLFALRTSTAKLVRYHDYPEWEELYDLERDPHELINLAADPAHRAERDRLRERLAELEHAIGPRARK